MNMRCASRLILGFHKGNAVYGEGPVCFLGDDDSPAIRSILTANLKAFQGAVLLWDPHGDISRDLPDTIEGARIPQTGKVAYFLGRDIGSQDRFQEALDAHIGQAASSVRCGDAGQSPSGLLIVVPNLPEWRFSAHLTEVASFARAYGVAIIYTCPPRFAFQSHSNALMPNTRTFVGERCGSHPTRRSLTVSVAMARPPLLLDSAP